MPNCRNNKRWLGVLALGCLFALATSAQTNVILLLKNGDRLAGTVLSEDTNHIIFATSWAKELTVPLSAIEKREASTNVVIVATPSMTTNAPALTAKPASAPATTLAVVKVATPPAPPPAPSAPKKWKASVQVGTDLLFGAVDRQLYNGVLNFTYAEPYKSDPKKFFRAIFDYRVDYGKTEGVKSTDRMNSSIKVDFDVGKRLYLYTLATVGYDDIRLIDWEYQAGPGVGYHLFAEPKFVMNTEVGLNYQEQDRAQGDDVKNAYGRLAEDVTWKISDRVTFSHKFEIFPNLQDTGEFRSRMEATVSFKLMQNLSLNITAIDLYDTSPALSVNNNELQIRSTVGVNF